MRVAGETRSRIDWQDCPHREEFYGFAKAPLDADRNGNRAVSGGKRCRKRSDAEGIGRESFWPAEDRHSRGGLQISRRHFPERSGAGHQWHPRYGREDSRDQEYMAENRAEPDARLERSLRDRIHQRGSGGRLCGKPAARNVAQEVGTTSREQRLLPNLKLDPQIVFPIRLAFHQRFVALAFTCPDKGGCQRFL